jgi:hypothetical protein
LVLIELLRPRLLHSYVELRLLYCLLISVNFMIGQLTQFQSK